MRTEEFFCLKCGGLVELLYLPSIDRVTEDLFKEMQEACLCKDCLYDYSPPVAMKSYLH